MGDYGHILLLASLMGFLLMPLLAYSKVNLELLPGILTCLMIISGLSVSYHSFKYQLLSRIGGGVMVVGSIVSIFDYSAEWVQIFFQPVIIGYIFFLTVHLFIQILKRKEVDFSMIINAVSVYLMVGIIASIAFSYVHAIDHSSLSIPYKDDINNFYDYIYLSFVTLTTLGYGDLVPTKPSTKAISIVLSVFNVFYIGVIIAVLIGKYLSANQKKN